MTARKNPPLLLRSGLTERIWIVTRYTDHGDGRITATEKYDVTDVFNRLRDEARDPFADGPVPTDAELAAAQADATDWGAPPDE